MNQKTHTNEKEKRQRILAIISDELGIPLEDLRDNADLKEDLNAEDLEIADLLAKLEKEFLVEVDQREGKKLKTLGEIVNYFLEG